MRVKIKITFFLSVNLNEIVRVVSEFNLPYIYCLCVYTIVYVTVQEIERFLVPGVMKLKDPLIKMLLWNIIAIIQVLFSYLCSDYVRTYIDVTTLQNTIDLGFFILLVFFRSNRIHWVLHIIDFQDAIKMLYIGVIGHKYKRTTSNLWRTSNLENWRVECNSFGAI